MSKKTGRIEIRIYNHYKDKFRTRCEENGTTPTDAINSFIDKMNMKTIRFIDGEMVILHPTWRDLTNTEVKERIKNENK